MQISKAQPMRPALDSVIDAVNDIDDIGPYVTAAVDDWLDEHPEATTTVQDDSLTTAKYQDGSVTGAKIATAAVTTEKIADGAVTYDKIHEPDLLMVGGAESVTNNAAITREYLNAPVPNGIGDGLALIESVQGAVEVQDGELVPAQIAGIASTDAQGGELDGVEWPTQTLRAAGSVRDELTAGELVTRVGVVDLGKLDWTYNTSYDYHFFYPNNSMPADFKVAPSVGLTDYVACAKYTVIQSSSSGGFRSTDHDGCLCPITNAGYKFAIQDTNYTDAATFKAAMDGVLLFYPLVTPTTTPISPALPMTYKVEQGGTERVMVASGTTSAPPIFVTRYPVNLTDLAESIAPRESTIATGNHAIGDLIMLGWTLCKATQVIVTGETIEIGTNVTRTTVAAEIAALS